MIGLKERTAELRQGFHPGSTPQACSSASLAATMHPNECIPPEIISQHMLGVFQEHCKGKAIIPESACVCVCVSSKIRLLHRQLLGLECWQSVALVYNERRCTDRNMHDSLKVWDTPLVAKMYIKRKLFMLTKILYYSSRAFE